MHELGIVSVDEISTGRMLDESLLLQLLDALSLQDDLLSQRLLGPLEILDVPLSRQEVTRGTGVIGQLDRRVTKRR